MLNRPNWLRDYPDLWDSLPGLADGLPTDGAPAALQRILDVRDMASLLQPVLPPGYDAMRLRWVCDLLREAACAPDTRYAKLEHKRETQRDDAVTFATMERERAKHQPQFAVSLWHAAEEAEMRDSLFNGPPAFERPGPELAQRRAAQVLYHCARPLRLKEPDLCRLIAALVNAAFLLPGKPSPKKVTEERVRGIIRAEQKRLRK